MKEILVHAEHVAAAFGVTSRQVRNYVELGMPRRKRGQYEFVECVKWFVAHREKEHEKRLASMGPGARESRKERVEADILELKLAELRGNLVRRADVDSFWGRLISAAKVQLLAIPAKVAKILVDLKSVQEVQMILTTEIDHALDELSRTDLDTGSIRDPEEDGAAGDATLGTAKETQSQPVGRRKAVHPARGKSHRTRKVAHRSG